MKRIQKILSAIFYWLLRQFFSLVLRIFFRDIQVLGLQNIPKDGPVIFVGNHANQFIDPLILLTSCDRSISFLIAAKSLRRPIIGFFARQMKSIGIERPQDIAKNASGKLTADGKKVIGIGTKFTKELEPLEGLALKGCNEAPRVDKIISDTELTLKEPFERPVESEGESFKVRPRIDHSEVYDSVWKGLSEGKCIGIFPEGGSHDRSDLLPLKAGVTIMAFGAMERYKDMRVYIVPCGLNYFSGHKFRSHVLVEFGPPLVVTNSMLEFYKKDKRQACAELLTNVERRLRAVTLTFPNYEVMQQIQTARRLYQPKQLNLTADQYLELIRRFTKGYVRFSDHPKVKEIGKKINEYNKQLEFYGLKDYQIPDLELGKSVKSIAILTIRIIFSFMMLLLFLPGFIINAPVPFFAKYLALKEAHKALKSSDVKIEGRDVIATYKLLVSLVLVPLIYFVEIVGVLIFYGWRNAVVFTLCIPIFSYACVKVFEQESQVWATSIPLAYSFVKSSFYERVQELRSTREKLQVAVRDLVEKLGPELGEDFWKKRIIPVEQLSEGENIGATPSSVLGLGRKRYKRKSLQQELEDAFEDYTFLSSS